MRWLTRESPCRPVRGQSRLLASCSNARMIALGRRTRQDPAREFLEQSLMKMAEEELGPGHLAGVDDEPHVLEVRRRAPPAKTHPLSSCGPSCPSPRTGRALTQDLQDRAPASSPQRSAKASPSARTGAVQAEHKVDRELTPPPPTTPHGTIAGKQAEHRFARGEHLRSRPPSRSPVPPAPRNWSP